MKYTNLQKLFEETKNLDRATRATFEDYFIGALSVLTSEQSWNKAIETAKLKISQLQTAVRP